MPFRSVDVVAAGPPSSDLYDPAAPAWALAVGFARRGASVRVLHPVGLSPGTPPRGVTAVPVEIPLRHPGHAAEPAEFAAAAGRQIRAVAELVVRDPAGLGRLAPPRRGGTGPAIAAVLRSVELASFDRERGARPASGVLDRLDTWRDRRSVRRLERQALDEADRLFFDAPEVAKSVAREYDVPERRLRASPPAIAPPDDGSSRAEARAAFRLPLDVPVVLAPAPVESAEASGIDWAREAFRRVHPLFPGVRLLVVGAPPPTEPGVSGAAERDATTFARAVAAADLALVAGRADGVDPAAVLSLQAGVPVIAGPGARFPDAPLRAIRRCASDDAGDAASALAELLADPALRRELGTEAREYAKRFAPEEVAAAIEAALRPAGG